MKTPEEQLEAVKSALGLVEDGDVSKAMATLEELLQALKEQEQDPRTEAARSLAQRAALPPRRPRSSTRGTSFVTPHGSVLLTASELKECKRAGAQPEVFAANKAKRLARRRA